MLMLAGFRPAMLVGSLNAGVSTPKEQKADTSDLLSMFAGRWKVEKGGSCFVRSDDIGTNIIGNSITEYESGCTMSEPTRDGYDVVGKLSCSGEGEEWVASLRMKSRDIFHMTWTQPDASGTKEFKMSRCF